ncbi:SusC/RagA family TonB-linked outer membrane protein [Bacteroidia bacterium]|nr:SusC/RagA family TonB-linked outer membrane protein [Bacteroidia bacterium]
MQKQKNKKLFLLIVVWFAWSFTGFAQTFPVSGTINDENGETLIGVSVRIKGGSAGTVSDMDGRYTISVPNDKTVLQFYYMGYEAVEQRVGSQREINIVLKEADTNLDELVVVGYGTQRRRDLTGAVASIGGEKLKDIPVSSAAQAMVGKLAGVQVTQTEGSPDAEMKIRVRGGGSITQDNAPLFIIDGFPADNINDVAPTDIASIDVLKDASSTAIYGARGANGVIIVTTKSGYEGKAKVSYNTYFGTKKVTNYLEVLDPYEFAYWQYESQQQNGNYERYYGNFADMDLYKEMSGTNWQKEIFGNTGTTLYNNLSLTGGSKTVKYNVSLTNNDDKDIMTGSKMNRTNLTSNLQFEMSKWLTVNMNVRLSDSKTEGAGVSDPEKTFSRLTHVVQYRPVNGLLDYIDDSMVDMDDYDVVEASIINPLKQTNDDYRYTNRQSFQYNGSAVVKLLKSLTYQFDFGYKYAKNIQKRFWGINTSNAITYGIMPLAQITNTNGTGYRIANVLTFNQKNFIPDHSLTVMAGQEVVVNDSEILTVSAKYFPQYISRISALSMMQLGKADPLSTVDVPEDKLASFFGRLNYDYKDRYLATLTFRADASSKFAPGNQWGYFPAGSVAWRISDEPFLTSQAEDWLSNLKLRVSYGAVGNNRIPDNAWLKMFSIPQSSELYLFLDGEDSPTAYLAPEKTLSNPGLKWETTITRNIGLDFGLFKQRLSGSIELYKNTTRDLLIQSKLPSQSGYTSQWQNIGQTSNQGVEVMLEGVLIQKKDFNLSASVNIAFNRNRIDRLDVPIISNSNWTNDSDGPTEDFLVEQGGKVGLMYGFVTDGFYTFDDFNYENGVYSLKDGTPDNSTLVVPRQFRPGALKFKNFDDDPLITNADKQIIGDANPLHTGGFNISSQYKNFDVSVFFNWVYGNDIYNANKLAFTNFKGGKYNKNLLEIMNSENRWTYYDQTTGARVDDPEQLRAMNANATLWSAANSKIPLHSWAIEDGSFLRLNNVTIGYSLPKKWLQKIKVEQLRFYATGYNLWVWTNYTGYDPEVDAVRSTPLTPGIDYSAYPRSRSFNVGLNLTF